jgi:hypothetical protein
MGMSAKIDIIAALIPNLSKLALFCRKPQSHHNKNKDLLCQGSVFLQVYKFSVIKSKDIPVIF